MNSASVPEKIEKAISDFGMEKYLSSIIVGYSGGADSSALLAYLVRRAEQRGTRVAAVHVNHGIRGSDADSDEAFCRARCAEWNIPFFSVRADIPLLARERKKGIEETAREFRYSVFCDKMRTDPSVTAIVTAHNADDNAETVLFHLSRGTALKGLCGIPPVTESRVLRPLIYCTKEEIIAFCEGNTIPYVIDKTNSDTAYTRNFIRHTVIKELENVNPEVRAAISRMCASVRRDNAALTEWAEASFSRFVTDSQASRVDLLTLPEAILCRVLDKMYGKIGRGELSYANFSDILSALRSDRTDKDVSLPGGVLFSVSRNTVCFRTEEDASPFQYPITMGENEFDSLGWKIILSFEEKIPAINENIYKLSTYQPINFDKINGSVFIRSRRDGDRYFTKGMTKSVKRMMCDAHVPRWRRNRIPLFCDENGIFYICGMGLRDDLKTVPNCRVLHLFAFEKRIMLKDK